jgi:predicted Zn finger-like uncharacterized protein
MLVQCPSCMTTFNVADELLTDTTPAFRCSRCKHIFEMTLQAPAEPSAATTEVESTAQIDDKAGELPFVFGAQEPEPPSIEHEQHENGEGQVPEFPRPEPVDTLVEQDLQRWSLSPAAKDQEALTVPDGTSDRIKANSDGNENGKRSARVSREISPTAQTSNISVLEPYRDQQASTLPYLSLFALLILFFSLATAFQYAYPELSDRWVKKMPIIGAAIARNHRLKDGVRLQSVRGTYQVIQGNREIFVVTGIAMNQNPVVIREVRIGGETYSSDEKSIEQQQMWIGNAISPKIIRGMTAQDILDLQRLKPLKTFEIPPGDSVPFTIVFLKPARAVKNFSCTVLAAEEEA